MVVSVIINISIMVFIHDKTIKNVLSNFFQQNLRLLKRGVQTIFYLHQLFAQVYSIGADFSAILLSLPSSSHLHDKNGVLAEIWESDSHTRSYARTIWSGLPKCDHSSLCIQHIISNNHTPHNLNAVSKYEIHLKMGKHTNIAIFNPHKAQLEAIATSKIYPQQGNLRQLDSAKKTAELTTFVSFLTLNFTIKQRFLNQRYKYLK